MDLDPTESRRIGERLNQLLLEASQPALPRELAAQFGAYCTLLLRWNARTNLTAIRDEDGILRRHFVESIACARALPAGITTLLDFGSGAGFPGLPIALCRREFAVTLAESQNKKAAFLQEVTRCLEVRARVHAGRAEMLGETFDCVILRAVDRMSAAVRSAAELLGASGRLAVLTTLAASEELRSAAGPNIAWSVPTSLSPGTDRILLLGVKGLLGAKGDGSVLRP